MKILRINIISFHIIIACILFNTNCGSDSIIPGMPAAYTQTVGAAGATVTDPRGGQVIIPAEALASDIVISITTYSATDMKRYYGIGSFTSCIDLGPDGTMFSVPVTVSIPATGITPEAAYPIYIFKEETGEWTEHSSSGTGSAGGDSIVFETSHFSTYAGSSGSGIRATVNSSLTLNMNMAIAYDALQASFEGMIGMQQAVRDKTYEVSGLLFDLQYSINGNEGQMQDLVGDMALKESKLNAYYDYSTAGGSGPLVENQVIYEIQITVYWKEVDDTLKDRTFHIAIDVNFEDIKSEPYPGLEDIYYIGTSLASYTAHAEFDLPLKAENMDESYFYFGGYSDGYSLIDDPAPAVTLSQQNDDFSVTIFPGGLYEGATVTNIDNPANMTVHAEGMVYPSVMGDNPFVYFGITNRDEDSQDIEYLMCFEVEYDIVLDFKETEKQYITGFDILNSSDLRVIGFIEFYDGNHVTGTAQLGCSWLDYIYDRPSTMGYGTYSVTVTEVK